MRREVRLPRPLKPWRDGDPSVRDFYTVKMVLRHRDTSLEIFIGSMVVEGKGGEMFGRVSLSGSKWVKINNRRGLKEGYLHYGTI